MSDEFIEFNHWENGELIKRELRTSYPLESKTNLICPFDKTPILRWHDGHGDKGYNCPNCNIEYKIYSGTQKAVNEFYKSHLENLKLELINLEKKKITIESILSPAENTLLNKANLSSKYKNSLIDDANFMMDGHY